MHVIEHTAMDPWLFGFIAVFTVGLLLYFSTKIVGLFFTREQALEADFEQSLSKKAAGFRLSLLLISLAAALQVSSVNYMRSVTKPEIDATLRKADSVFSANAQTLIPETSANLKCLKYQYEGCQKIKEHYFNVGFTYYMNFYTFSICAIVFGVIMAIGTALLVSRGWALSPPLIRTLFLVSVLISSFYFLLPTVLNNRENYALNLKKVKTFQQIQMNILSFSTFLTAPEYTKKPDTLQKFLVKNFADISNNLDLETVEIRSERLGDNPQNLLNNLKPSTQ